MEAVWGNHERRPLQHQFEREAKLHLQDHKDIAAAGTGPDCNDIAPGDLTFGFVSPGLQEPLGNRVERGLLQPGIDAVGVVVIVSELLVEPSLRATDGEAQGVQRCLPTRQGGSRIEVESATADDVLQDIHAV